jgi:hypothetical protein
MRNLAILLVAVFLGSCSACGDKPSTTEPEPPPKPVEKAPEPVFYTLEVIFLEGVTGAPVAGEHKFRAGEPVNYSYRPTAGYVRVSVEADTILRDSGTIALVRDTKLYISAEKELVVEPAGEPVKNSVSAYLSATTEGGVVELYAEHMRTVGELYAHHSPSDAMQLALTAQSSAYENVDDESFGRAEKALGGKMFGSGGSVEHDASYRIQTNSSSGWKISVAYVPGVLSTAAEAGVAREELRALLAESGLDAEVEVFHLPNASTWHNPDRNKRCLMAAFIRQSAAHFLSCQTSALFGDFSQASSQIASILREMPKEAEEDALNLRRFFEREFKAKRCVIAVGHSQGTLMIQEAIRGQEYDSRCFGVISVGGPLGQATWLPVQNPELAGVLHAGAKSQDIVAFLWYNDFSRVSTNLSNAADELITLWETKYVYTTAAKLLIYKRIAEDLKLHYMVSGYLAGDRTREWLGAELDKQARRLLTCTECFGPPPTPPPARRIYASSGIGTGAYGTSDLWIVTPHREGTDTLVGRIRTPSGYQPSITDLAEAPDGLLWAVSMGSEYGYDALYTIDTGTVITEARGVFTGISGVNALAFDQGGILYAAGGRRIMAIENPASDPKVLWTKEFGGSYVSSGDIAFSPDGTPYAVVKDFGGRDLLARLDLTAERNVVVSAHTIGKQDVWGLVFRGETLFALTAHNLGKGELITIDPLTGTHEVVRMLSFSAFGAARPR